MINLFYTGNLIRNERRKLNLTQEKFSELLDVSPQAVSKWENGMSMPDIEILLKLSELFHVSINDLLQKQNLLDQISIHPYKENDIVLYIDDQEKIYNRDWIQLLQEQDLVNYAWTKQRESIITQPFYRQTAKDIVNEETPVLEIGIGPGGGFVPSILNADPEHEIILNDLSPYIIRKWKSILSRYPEYTNVYYAVFDFTDIPFASESIGVVSDHGGLADIEGDKVKAIHEIFRVLKPGGVLMTTGSFASSEGVSALLPEQKQMLFSKFPYIQDSMYDHFIETGFSSVRTSILNYFTPSPEDSELGKELKRMQIHLPFVYYLRVCRK